MFFLNTKDVSVELGISIRHVYYLVQHSYLAGIKICRNWRFYQGDVQTYANGKDVRRINKRFTAYSNNQRCGGYTSLLSVDNQGGDKIRQASGLHHNGRADILPNKPKRPYKVSNKVFKSIDIDAKQLKFDFTS